MSTPPTTPQQQIQTLYSRFLQARSLRPRLGQKQMIAEIARIVSRIGDPNNPAIGCIEAPTGTGKTLAYLIAGLPYAKEQGLTLVVSTATVALQSQLIEKDLPALLESTDWTVSWALAKGRRRYLCPLRLEAVVAQAESGDSLYPDELTLFLDQDDRAQIQGITAAWVSGQWSGDMDQWKEPLSDSVRNGVTTDHRRCQGRRCPSFSACPYFIARESWMEADVLVVNHDLLLSDLKLGGGVVLPPYAHMMLVVDEAHQLTRIAAEQLTEVVRVGQSLGAIKSLERLAGVVAGYCLSSHGVHQDCQRLPEALAGLAEQLVSVGRACIARVGAAEDSSLSFVGGATRLRLRLDDTLAIPAEVSRIAASCVDRGERILEWLKGAATDGSESLPSPEAQALVTQWGLALGRLESIPSVLDAFGAIDQAAPDARWIRVGQDARHATIDDPADVELWASPLVPASQLAEALWGQVAAAVLTSATLAHDGHFDGVKETLGLPDCSSLVVAEAFDYARQGRLRIPEQAGDPRAEDAHAARIVAYLETRVDSGLGLLVLFTSWRLLQKVEEGLSTAARGCIHVQGQLPLEALLKRHQGRRDAGQTSMLFGLQTMAEGLDLPGDLANEVVITRLPFQPPDDPREATYADYLTRSGRDPFTELSLPSATIRLRQAVGRLIRSETDTGQVTVLDRRLVNTRWGRSLLQALPSFQIEE